MKKRVLLLLGGLLAVSLYSQTGTPVKTILERNYLKFSTAVLKRNIEDIKKLSTSDFIYKYKNGTQMNLKESLDMLKMNLLMMKSVQSASFKINKLTIAGNVATSITDIKVAATIAGSNGKTQKLLNTSQTKDTWINTPKGWLIKRSEELKSSTTIDGKRVG